MEERRTIVGYRVGEQGVDGKIDEADSGEKRQRSNGMAAELALEVRMKLLAFKVASRIRL